MFQGAFDAILDCGGQKENIVRWNVPGSFELIYGCKKMTESFDMLDAVIAIGSVIQGETKHFDYVCEAVAQGIKDLNVQGVFINSYELTLSPSKVRSSGGKLPDSNFKFPSYSFQLLAFINSNRHG